MWSTAHHAELGVHIPDEEHTINFGATVEQPLWRDRVHAFMEREVVVVIRILTVCGKITW